jgi:ATP-dependent DNA ligase
MAPLTVTSEGAASRRRACRSGRKVIERGYEGYVAKDEASPYEGGPTWRLLKVKQRDWTIAEDRWRRRIDMIADRQVAKWLSDSPAPRTFV